MTLVVIGISALFWRVESQNGSRIIGLSVQVIIVFLSKGCCCFYFQNRLDLATGFFWLGLVCLAIEVICFTWRFWIVLTSFRCCDRQISEPSTDLQKTKKTHIGSAFSAAAVKIFSAASSRGNWAVETKTRTWHSISSLIGILIMAYWCLFVIFTEL